MLILENYFCFLARYSPFYVFYFSVFVLFNIKVFVALSADCSEQKNMRTVYGHNNYKANSKQIISLKMLFLPDHPENRQTPRRSVEEMNNWFGCFFFVCVLSSLLQLAEQRWISSRSICVLILCSRARIVTRFRENSVFYWVRSKTFFFFYHRELFELPGTTLVKTMLL